MRKETSRALSSVAALAVIIASTLSGACASPHASRVGDASERVRSAPSPSRSTAAGGAGHGDEKPPPLRAEGVIGTRIAAVFDRQCVSCHDEHHRLDLRALPTSVDVWERIHDVVDSGRMPPPTRSGHIDPAERSALVEDVSRLLDRNTEAHAHVRTMTADEWYAVLLEVAAPSVPAEEVGEALATHRGAIGGLQGFPAELGAPRPHSPIVGALGWLNVHLVARDVCSRILVAEAKKPGPMPLAGGFDLAGPLDAASATAVATAILRRVRREEPRDDNVARVRSLLQKIHASTRDTTEAVIGACTALLAGPATFVVGFDPEAAHAWESDRHP